MNSVSIRKFNASNKTVLIVLALCVLVFVVLTFTQDLLRSTLKSSAFYFSESLMFSSFWWLFAPLLFAQYVVVKHNTIRQLHFQIPVVLLPVLIHLFAFPFLVWALSSTFYYHSYAFQQILMYTISEHIQPLALMYSIPVLTFRYYRKTLQPGEPVLDAVLKSTTKQYINSLLVTEGTRKLPIAVTDILYFTANPPYINIHLACKKYLQNETLRSVSLKLNPEQFVRVHKSTLINIKMVASYTTRLNGDYDLTMKNNATLRVSRHFATDFKNLFNKANQLTTK